MVSPTPNIALTYPAHGGAVNAWDTPLNADFDAIDAVFAGTQAFAGGTAVFGAAVVLTQTQANNRRVSVAGLLTSDFAITFPAIGGMWIVDNLTTGAFIVTAKTAGSAATPITCYQGTRTVIGSNGTDMSLGDDSKLIAIPFAGNPNGSVAGTAASAQNPPSMVWDYTNAKLYVCTSTGTTVTAVWTVPNVNISHGFDTAVNFGLAVTHTGGNLLNIAVKTAAGTDPTATNTTSILFQTLAGTATTGAPTTVNITAALSMDSNALGATLGTTNNVPFRYWIALFNNAGTAVLAIMNASTATRIFAIPEYGIASTTGISAGATSAGVWYTPNGTSLVNCAFRIVGYLEYTAGLATAGTYSTDPSNVVLFGPGIKKPGDTVQTVYSTTTTTTTINSVVNTATALTATITPTSAINPIKVAHHGAVSTTSGGNGPFITQLYRNTGSVAIGNIATSAAGGSGTVGVGLANFAFDAPQSAASVQYGVYCKLGLAGTSYVYLGTANNTPVNSGVLIVEEIMG